MAYFKRIHSSSHDTHPYRCMGTKCYNTNYVQVLLNEGIDTQGWSSYHIEVAWAKVVIDSTNTCNSARRTALSILHYHGEDIPDAVWVLGI